jgi:putative transposase
VLFAEPAAIPEGEWSLFREAVQRGQLTALNRFVEKVETILGKRIEKRSRGDRRP